MITEINNEQAIIAAISLDSRVISALAEFLNPGDFEDERLGSLYREAVAMHATGKAVDTITLGERIKPLGIHGLEVTDLFEWTSVLPTASNATWYGQGVRDQAIRRQLVVVAQRLQREAIAAEPSVALANAQTGLHAIGKGAATRVESQTLGELLTEAEATSVEFDWVIDGLLERRDRLMITGSEGGGKSTLLRQMGILAAAGINPFTFYRTPPARALYIDAENTKLQWQRQVAPLASQAAMLGQADPRQNVVVQCTGRIDLTRDGDLAAIHGLIDRVKPDIVFIGPLYRLTPRAITNDDDAAPILAALDTIRDRGAALVVEAHAGNGQGGREREWRPRGSAALIGWPEFGFGLHQDRGGWSSEEWVLERWRGDREHRSWPTKLTRGAGQWPWAPTLRGQGK